MNRYTGKNLYLKWVTAAGTATLETYYRAFTPVSSVTKVAQSAGADTAESYLHRLTDSSATLELLAKEGADGTAEWALLEVGMDGTLTWGESGTTSGKPKHVVAAFVERRERPVKYEDLVKTSVTFQFQALPSNAVW